MFKTMSGSNSMEFCSASFVEFVDFMSPNVGSHCCIYNNGTVSMSRLDTHTHGIVQCFTMHHPLRGIIMSNNTTTRPEATCWYTSADKQPQK